MNSIIFCLALVCFVGLLVWLGEGYASIHSAKDKKEKWSRFQLAVSENRAVVGVSNKGTSMNDRKIYAVDAEKIGL